MTTFRALVPVPDVVRSWLQAVEGAGEFERFGDTHASVRPA